MADVTKNRHKFIGGSDVAAILGINKYKTSYEVWEEKKHGIVTFTGNNATEWGKKLEPVIVDHCEKKHEKPIVFRNKKFTSEIKFLAVHPDGIMKTSNFNTLHIDKNDIYIEGKTVSSKAHNHWQNELPLEYYCQVQHGMFCTYLEKAYFIYLILDDRDFKEIEVNRDNDFIEKQNSFLIEWWNRYIIGDEVPLKIAQDYEKENPDTSIIEADEEAIEIYEKLKEVKENHKLLTKEKEELENMLKEKIGSNTDLMRGLNTLATWRPQTRISIDTLKLKEEIPETYLKYAKETKTRTFLLKI